MNINYTLFNESDLLNLNKKSNSDHNVYRFLSVDYIPLNVATETFARHGLTSPLCSEGCDGRVMDVPQMVNCLTTLYCRLWDILVSQPDVVKINNAAGVSQANAPTRQTPSKTYNPEPNSAANNGHQTVSGLIYSPVTLKKYLKLYLKLQNPWIRETWRYFTD